MPDNNSMATVTEGVTSAQEIPSSHTSADDKTPTEPSSTPELDQNGSPEVTSNKIGEVVLTPLKTPKEKADKTPKKMTNIPKKGSLRSTNTKKGMKGNSMPEITRGKSLDAKISTPKKGIPQPTLIRQSTVGSIISTPGTPKKAVRLDVSLDGSNTKLGTPKKKIYRFRSKSPKKAAGKPTKKPQPLRSSTPKRSSSRAKPGKVRANPPEQEPKAVDNETNGGVEQGTENENSQEKAELPKRNQSASRAPKPQRKVFVGSTKPPKIMPRPQSPSKGKKGKPSAWR